jgi:hypothetical protein
MTAMFPPVATKDPTAVEVEVQSTCLAMFPNNDSSFVSRAFGWTINCFLGNYGDYQGIDARYHDLEHTMQGTLCMARLLHGRQKANAHPPISQRAFKLGLIAILMHDTGYLKRRDDKEGTGAKYTVMHVDRSAEFAAQLLRENQFTSEDVQAVKNMIRCTGLDAVLSVIPFQNETEKIVGHALGTADLLGQMSAEDYVEKLPVLYSEFAEGARHTRDKTHFITMFSSAEDMMRKTPTFWQNYVLPKLTRDFSGLYRFLNDPFPHGPNSYLGHVEANIERLRQRFGMVGK